MISKLKSYFAELRHERELRRKTQVAKPIVDFKGLFDLFDSSPAPSIFMVVMVWATCSVLLTSSMQQQTGFRQFEVGQYSPRLIVSKFDFEYEDLDLTNNEKKKVRESQPLYYKISAEDSDAVKNRFSDFFLQLSTRIEEEKNNRKYLPNSSEASRLVSQLSPELIRQLGAILSHPIAYNSMQKELDQILGRGVIDPKDKATFQIKDTIRIVDAQGRENLRAKNISEQPDNREAGMLLAKSAASFIQVNQKFIDSFAGVAADLFGIKGNMTYDVKRTEANREAAGGQVAPVKQYKHKGEVLLTQEQKITDGSLGMLKTYSELEQQRRNTAVKQLIHNMIWSLILITFAGFYLYHVHRDLVNSNKRIFMLGLIGCISVVINYNSIILFDFLYGIGALFDADKIAFGSILMINAIPISLVAVLLSVMMGYRVALCAGFFVSSVTAMMVVPDRSFDLAIKGMVICSLSAICVRSATNYRSFFIRIVLSVFPLTWIMNMNLLEIDRSDISQFILMSGALSLANGFLTAIMALILTFCFEIIFNVSTNMSLMVLCDYSHPLLERLKREAPGTFFHSLMVATLAEDAANCIGANPLRAKAGALFHDIGKLAMPQYFTENNLGSVNLHTDLNPQMSSMIIRDHVKEGLALAHKHRLCRTVREAILQHHGNDLVHFFFNKAVEEGKKTGVPVLESAFRYQGIPPQSKEMAIVSLADACEAACRSLEKPSPPRIESQVKEIFFRRFKDGQLCNANVTLEELAKIEQSFINTLISMKHGRIAYQKEGTRDKY